MKIYISIPIKGKDEAAQRALAAEIAQTIESSGHKAVNPFGTLPPPEWFDEDQTYAWYLSRDIEKLLQCDAIFLCNGWKDSRGCNIEFAVAREMGLQVFYNASDIESIQA